MARKGSRSDQAIYVISVAAELAGVHPQTLRVYERKGLVSPKRTLGNTRRYSERDIELLRRIQELTNEGVNLAGVKRILELENQVAALQSRISELQAQLEATVAEIGRREQQVHASYRRDLVLKRGDVLPWRPPPR